MQQRMLLAVVLSIAVLVIAQYYYSQFAPMPTGLTNQEDNASRQTQKVQPTTDTAVVKKAPSRPQLTQATAKEIVIKNNLAVFTLSSKGATIKSLQINNHTDDKGAPIVLKSDYTLPALSIGTDESFELSNAVFATSAKDIVLKKPTDKAEVTFSYADANIAVQRTFVFTANDYVVEVRDSISGLPHYFVTLGKDFGLVHKDESSHFGPVILRDVERKEFTASDLKDPKTFTSPINWIAQEDKYFFSAIIPPKNVIEAKFWLKNTDTLTALKLPAGDVQYKLYAGPKEHDRLQQVGSGLEHIVDFGFFSFLARPLFWALKWLYEYTHNYGVAIIIITILTRLPFVPLINKGQESMKRLQDIQPKMMEIKEKYKNDPQRMQKEMMELYRKHKVNPMGGCLPILLQIPVFFALYQVLNIAIELRHAPFVLWITDLSAKDPYFILPIIMGATMVIQQKMTPSTLDPMQQKIMLFMPILFTFLFFTFPSGLVLYWLINNILGIAQQFYINQKLAKRQASASA